jgi:hypothetical protein
MITSWAIRKRIPEEAEQKPADLETDMSAKLELERKGIRTGNLTS